MTIRRVFCVVDATDPRRPVYYFERDAESARSCREFVHALRTNSHAVRKLSTHEADKRIKIKIIELDKYSKNRAYSAFMDLQSNCAEPTEWSVARLTLIPASTGHSTGTCGGCGECSTNVSLSGSWRTHRSAMEQLESISAFEKSFSEGYEHNLALEDETPSSVCTPGAETSVGVDPDPIKQSCWAVVVDVNVNDDNTVPSSKSAHVFMTRELATQKYTDIVDRLGGCGFHRIVEIPLDGSAIRFDSL